MLDGYLIINNMGRIVKPQEIQKQQTNTLLGTIVNWLQKAGNAIAPATMDVAKNYKNESPLAKATSAFPPAYAAQHPESAGELTSLGLPMGEGAMSLATGAIRGGARPFGNMVSQVKSDIGAKKSIGQIGQDVASGLGNTAIGAATGAPTEFVLNKIFEKLSGLLFSGDVTSTKPAAAGAAAEEVGRKMTKGITPRAINESINQNVETLGNNLKTILKNADSLKENILSILDEGIQKIPGYNVIDDAWTTAHGDVTNVVKSVVDKFRNNKGEVTARAIDEARKAIGDKVKWAAKNPPASDKGYALDKVYKLTYDLLHKTESDLTKGASDKILENQSQLMSLVESLQNATKPNRQMGMSVNPVNVGARRLKLPDMMMLLLSRILGNPNLQGAASSQVIPQAQQQVTNPLIQGLPGQ